MLALATSGRFESLKARLISLVITIAMNTTGTQPQSGEPVLIMPEPTQVNIHIVWI